MHPQTGPTTPEGKSRSSDNATTHGGTSQKLIVAGEHQEDFTNLLTGLVAEFAPETPSARLLVEDFAHAQWFLWRRIRAQNSAEHALYEAQPDPALWPDASFHTLANMERYRTTAERRFQRALRNLEHLKYAQLSQSNRDQRQQNFETRLSLDQERVDLQKERHSLAVARDTRQVEATEAAAAEKEQADYEQACGEFDVPTLIQNICVQRSPHGTITEFDPPNKEIRAGLLNEDYQFPFESVFRKYMFEHGIPEEYWWDEKCEIRARSLRCTLTQALTRDTWLQMADKEKQNADGHAVSGYEFFDDEDDGEEEDEDETDPAVAQRGFGATQRG
jgi:hypothetical protein